MTRAAGRRVVFADADHVLALLHDLIDSGFADKRERLEDFIAPEDLADFDVEELTCGLSSMPDLQISQATKAADIADLNPHAIVVRRAAVSADLIRRCPELRLIQRLGQRTAGIDRAAAEDAGVQVSCLSRPSLVSVAEHVVMLMLAVSRHLNESHRAVRDGRRDPRATVDADGSSWNWAGISDIRPLRDRSLGIVGMGEVGELVAETALALGMRVRYTDTHSAASLSGVESVSLTHLLATSDFVSLHVPALAGTPPLINTTTLAHFKRGACLINTSRGSLVDEAALLEALRSGRIAAAALDVHAVEPRPQASPLLELDNVIMTPHVAAGSRRIVLSEAHKIFANIRAALDAQPPSHDVCSRPSRQTAAHD